MRFADIWVLILVILLPLIVYLVRIFRKGAESTFRFSNKGLIKDITPSFRVILSRRLIYLRIVTLFLIILALARPESAIEQKKVYVEGIDIILAVDVSGSMRAMDFEIAAKRVTRLEVVKDVVADFIKKRQNDRIGMIAFASLSYTVSPLTLDHDWLAKNLERVEIGMIEDGTAIGSAISASLNRLKGTEAKEKIVILLTDGRNNAGKVSPITASEAARPLNVKIHTIGAGSKGPVPYPVKDAFGNTVLTPVEIDIDDDLLEKIAKITGGAYFRATDTKSLKNIYDIIDKLEKTPMEEEGYNIYNELFSFFLIPGLILLLLEVILSNTWLRRMP